MFNADNSGKGGEGVKKITEIILVSLAIRMQFPAKILDEQLGESGEILISSLRGFELNSLLMDTWLNLVLGFNCLEIQWPFRFRRLTLDILSSWNQLYVGAK